jgi:hypothetical protein
MNVSKRSRVPSLKILKEKHVQLGSRKNIVPKINTEGRGVYVYGSSVESRA